MIYNAYWISPNGNIESVETTHIINLLDNPNMFGIKKDFIEKLKKEYPDEKIGQEGQMREKLMIEAMKNGWIRARKNRNSWIIQTYHLTKKEKDNIWDFIRHLVFDEKQSKYSEVTISVLSPEYYITSTFEDIISGNLYESNELNQNKKIQIEETIMKLKKNIKLKDLISNGKKVQTIVETKLGRIWKFITDSNSRFGIISASRGEYSVEENKKRTSKLASEIRSLGYGYIMLKGGFVEENGNEVVEISFFVPDITLKELLNLGKKYEQYSVLFKDGDSFQEIGTNPNSGIGKVLNKFSTKQNDSLTFDKDLIKNYYSSLIYGPHSKRKFLFKLQEREIANFNRIAYHKEPLQWYTLLEETIA